MTTTLSPSPAIRHPVKQIITPTQAMAAWGNGDYHLTRKYDGEFCSDVVIRGHRLITERMKQKSGGLYTPDDLAMFRAHGEFHAAITIAEIDGENVLNRSTQERDARLRDLFEWAGMESYFVVNGSPVILASQVAPERIINFDGEGICAVEWSSAWGFMQCVKRHEIYELITGATGNTQSVELFDPLTGQSRGRVKMGGGKIDKIRHNGGSIIRVECLGLTDDGKLREPKLCREWLQRF